MPRSVRPLQVGIASSLVFLIALVASVPLAVAEPAQPDPADEFQRPDGIHVLDGSYVLDSGNFHVNITNHGLIGSQYTQTYPYSVAPSGQWPGSSGHEYLYGAGLWVGGRNQGQVGVTTGQPERELRPGLGVFDTIYESKNQTITRPWAATEKTGIRLPDWRADDDRDGVFDDDPMSGYDDDGDGLVDEDYGQIGDQMFTCTMFDDTPLVRELYPGHTPLGLTVVQRAATWETQGLEDIVILDFQITNSGTHALKDVYLGFYMDADIQRRGQGANEPDDLAGFFNGPIRAEDGAYHRIQVAWMRDADPVDPLPGWIGCVQLFHDTDFLGKRAPNLIGVRSFQIFATNASANQNGEPLSDEERYALMAKPQHDVDRSEYQSGDLKVMVSCGPFGTVERGRTLNYRLALVMGDSKQAMLAQALRASQLQRETWLYSGSTYPSFGNKETKVCVGDLPPYSDGSDPIWDYRSAFMDESCSGSDPIFGIPLISPTQMFEDEDGRKCIWVNADNCDECYRALGQDCTLENGLFWRFFGTGGWPGTVYSGGGTHVPWVEYDEIPPIPPNMRLMPGPRQVEVFWDDLSEYDVDYYRRVIDFESYRVWRVADWTREHGAAVSDGPPTRAWGMIAEYDLVSFLDESMSPTDSILPLGRNTGLEPALYAPACLSDPRFEGLAEAMADFVVADVEGRHTVRPHLRDSGGSIIEGREALIPWESFPDVLDTFFAVTPRDTISGAVGKRAVNYYHFIDTDVSDGFETYYSVVASDHHQEYNRWTGSRKITGYGIQAEPGNNYQSSTPGPTPQTAEHLEKYGRKIYVYPNPATYESLAEFQQQPPNGNDPTGVRIMFNNLPAARNLISIFTTSGDLVDTVEHDGTDGGVGAASWNLVSRNGQEIVSGIYLYTVESDDENFEDFRGTFVVIR